MQYQIHYGLNWKCNLGNFENVDTNVGITVTGEEGENPKQTLERARKFVERELEEAVIRNRRIIEGQ